MATKSELLASANAKLQELKASTTTEEVDKISTEIEDFLKQVNGLELSECYEKIFNSENPMLSALHAEYKRHSLQDKKDKDTGKTVYSIAEKDLQVNLWDIANKRDIGVNPHWVHLLEKVNMLFTLRVANSIGNEAVFTLLRKNPSYFMSSKAHEMEIAEKQETVNGKKVANPISNGSLVADLQALTDEMFGKDEYKVFKKDLNFVLEAYSKQSRANRSAVVCPTARNFAVIIAGMLDGVVDRKVYGIESKPVDKGIKALEKASAK